MGKLKFKILLAVIIFIVLGFCILQVIIGLPHSQRPKLISMLEKMRCLSEM